MDKRLPIVLSGWAFNAHEFANGLPKLRKRVVVGFLVGTMQQVDKPDVLFLLPLFGVSADHEHGSLGRLQPQRGFTPERLGLGNIPLLVQRQPSFFAVTTTIRRPARLREHLKRQMIAGSGLCTGTNWLLLDRKLITALSYSHTIP